MKPIVPFILFISVVFILTSGCITMANKNPLNTTTVATSDPGINKTINATANITSELKGSLKVSISGISYPANLSVVLDNENFGVVTPTTPLYLMVSEGNHTVRVCEHLVCKQENVTTRFGGFATVDFSEQILKDVTFPNPTAPPTAHILEYYRNGDALSVEVEFFNPSINDLQMTAHISCGYSYIDNRNIKKGDGVNGKLDQNVKAGQRMTETLDLHFASVNALSYSSPVIDELIIK